MQGLSQQSLPQVTVPVPGYDRRGLRPGILHFGVGNFFRAHQAAYLDRLMNMGLAQDFAIIGAGVMAGDNAMRDALAAQDHLYTLVEQSARHREARVLGPIADFIAPGDHARLIATMADPAIRIVSLTITEGGYFIDADSGRFDPTHPAIAADAANPGAPRTVFGLIAAGLKARRASGHAPFTVMCCDNIPHNGRVTRAAVVETARLSDPGLAEWIAATVAFPNAMVDRITPATSDRERQLLREEFGITDAVPVFCEDFTQWVLEDDFPAGRPPLERAGVEFVRDVTPWELMKIRILNGGHAVIAYPAGLLDIHFVHEAMADPQIRAFLEKIERDEIIPAVPPVPGTDLPGYFARVAERCANPRIGDTVRRLCLDGSNRQPKFIVPTVAHRLERDQPVNGLALESALWCRYCAGTSDNGAEIPPNDPNWDRLTARARAARDDPAAWLGMAEIYGATGRDPRFAEPFAQWLAMLWAKGTRATLSAWLAD